MRRHLHSDPIVIAVAVDAAAAESEHRLRSMRGFMIYVYAGPLIPPHGRRGVIGGKCARTLSLTVLCWLWHYTSPTALAAAAVAQFPEAIPLNNVLARSHICILYISTRTHTYTKSCKDTFAVETRLQALDIYTFRTAARYVNTSRI